MVIDIADRCRSIVEALPTDTVVAAMFGDDDPIVTSCLPHPAVRACIEGRASEADVVVAEAWMASRPDVQRRAAMLMERLLADLTAATSDNLPGWLAESWSAVIRCPWGYGLDDAVATGELFYAAASTA